ncbi:inorganic phosphate transporter [Halopelagius longus]|uniref:Phosphate transporter n=1 Tax=Halopelagius longus TaxID=1236180 RepID=A0A1H1ERT3_9EURY|nr:inorganic phosphate transporter [Halopelagius longus]RDI71867.1 inorganic phosphate transporter [Halopelagius longus]SDQ91457.1 inorganic phosphate transporter, PiT family [Halopelagius longus]
MVEVLLVIGLVVAAFVGFNIGGSSTGVAFGPAVGSDIVSKLAAAALMTGFAFLGAWTAGRNVIETMGGQIVPESQFTLAASVAVLFFVGLALLISNTFGVPASTSMTAVGAIAGLGVATGTLNAEVMLEIISWWIVAPVIAFWICAVVGRYVYPYLDAKLKLDRSPGPLLTLDRSGAVPRPTYGPNTTPRELGSIVLVVVIACYMAFSAGASNAANAVAPLVGNGAVGIDAAILLAAGAIGLGAFTIARRTLDTVGNDLTELPILAALVVETVSASLIAMLSWLGIPASLAVSATMCIVGLGWGRATRSVTIGEALGGKSPGMSVNALTAETDENVPAVGEESETDLAGRNLFDPGTTGRVIFFWLLTPSLSAAASYVLFALTSF